MLYLWMPEGDAAWRWRIHVQDDWQSAATLDILLHDTQQAALNEKNSNDKIREAIVFFPTSSVQMLRQPMTRQQLRQIGATGVRYLLEEFALVPVDQLAVHYQMDDHEHVNIMALPLGLIQQYQNILALGGWKLQALLPDFLLIAVPQDINQASLLINQHQRVMRTSAMMAYAADDLAIILDYLPQLSQVDIWGETTVQDQVAIQGVVGLTTSLQDWKTPIAVLSDAQYIRHPYNVLPKPKSQLSGYWRAIAVVLVTAIVVQMLYDGVRVWRYNKIATQTNAMAVQQYQAWFPEERRIVNLKNQFMGHLQNNNTTDVTALTLMSRIGPSLQQANLTANQVQYRDNSLELTLVAGGLPALESLRSQLVSQGLKAELGAVNPANGQVSGLLRVQL